MGLLNDISSSRQGIIIISIIWGLGLSAIFRKVCRGRNCIVIQAPNVKEIEKNIYEFDGKCYRFKSQTTSCKKA